MQMRRNLRLSGFDYSQDGFYFVTVCTNFKEPFLSEIVYRAERPISILTPAGKAVEETIQYIRNNYDGVSIDKYCIMPNHIHLIIALGNACGGRETRHYAMLSADWNPLQQSDFAKCSIRRI